MSRALWNISSRLPGVAKLLGANAVGPLIELLRTDSDSAKEHAAAILWEIATTEEGTTNFVAVGGAVGDLVMLLHDGNAIQTEKTSGALRYMAVHSTNVVKTLLSTAMEPLIALLQNGTDISNRNAAACLWQIALTD